MPMETLLTLAIILGVPLWLAAEELLHRFRDKPSGLKVVQAPVASGPAAKRDARPPMETTTSHVA
jgi:hypothetical protein